MTTTELRAFTWPLLILVATVALNLPALRAAHNEGDEVVHKTLTTQLLHGRYTLRGTPVQGESAPFAPSLYDRPIHYNPPLYNLVLLFCKLLTRKFPWALLSVLSTALTGVLVFFFAQRRGGVPAGAVAAAAFLLCPITLLGAGKVWSEAFLSLLLFAALFLLDRLLDRHLHEPPHGPPRSLAPVMALLFAAALVKITALLALPGLLWAAWRLPHRLRAVAAVALPPLLGSVAWLVFVAFVSAGAGQSGPGPGGFSEDRFRNPFVFLMAHKRPWSFFVAPFLLDPAFFLIFPALADSRRRRELLHVLLYALGILLGFTVLAWQGTGTYHNKYIVPAMPALAVLAGAAFAPPSGTEARPPLSPLALRVLVSGALIVLLLQWLSFVAHPQAPEVDPHQFGWPIWITR